MDGGRGKEREERIGNSNEGMIHGSERVSVSVNKHTPHLRDIIENITSYGQ